MATHADLGSLMLWTLWRLWTLLVAPKEIQMRSYIHPRDWCTASALGVMSTMSTITHNTGIPLG